jgi:Phage XkdN-like protein.
MSALLDFLIENPVDGLTETFRLTDRIPYDFTIRPFTSDEIEEFRKRAKMKLNVKTKQVDVDFKKLKEIICVECTIEPCFNDAETLKKVGCTNGREFLNKVLAGGEIDTLYEHIGVLSGYGRDINEEVEEAKN